MSTHELSPRQVRCIPLLISGMQRDEAAKIVGVNARTIRRWMSDEAFRNELQRGISKQLQSASMRLVSLYDVVIDELSELLTGDVSPGIKLRAIVAYADITNKLVELSDIEARIEVLEDWVIYGKKTSH